MQSKQQKQSEQTGRTRGLLLVTFFTLTLTAFSFLFALFSLDHNNRKIFAFVKQNIENSSSSSELYSLLVNFEFDVRDLITVVIREPYKLTSAKDELKEQFNRILNVAESMSNVEVGLLKQLRWYQANLDRLMRDYGALNSTLYEVYFYISNIKEKLVYLEESAGNLMVELATEGHDTEAVQQSYVLISIVYEKMLQSHILVNSSVANYDPKLLVLDEGSVTDSREEDTVIGIIQSMKNTLRTLTVAEEAIAVYAVTIQETIPLLEDNIYDLSVALNNLNEHTRLFYLERENTMKLLDNTVERNHLGLFDINKMVDSYSKQTRLIAWLISFAVILISIVGLLLTRKMSQQLEKTTNDALLAREAEKYLNEELTKEVEARRKISEDLIKSRDELEQRVKERTAELSSANRGLALEIEERKNAEFALAQEKEQLSVTLRSIGDGVITTAIDGSIVLMNMVAEDMTGWEQSEATGKNINEVFKTINRLTDEFLENPVEGLLHDGSVYYNLAEDKTLVARDGTEYEISDSCAPITDKNSNIIGAVLVFRDVSDKKKMQDEALKSEKLKSVGILAGGIAHDFNNILAAIVGNISLAKMNLDSGDTQALKLLEGAEKASLRARNLTQQLLTFSKGGEPVRKIESIGDIIRDSTDFILSGGKVHCTYAIDEGLWPVRIDSGQISQVVQNIIINSMHAMPLGGELVIDCSNVDNSDGHVTTLPKGNFVRVSIKDEGPGIPVELQDQIFDPYFTTKEEGSGLGLALTHSIVAKHQGVIDFQTGDWGTEFIIHLPALPDSKLVKANEIKVDSKLVRGNVLIMDDEDMIREIAGDLLSHLGFNVSTVSDGEQAVKLYRERMVSDDPFDAVIMDLTIPGGMGGKEAIQRLLDIDPNVKAIVSSGYSNDPVMADYEHYGFVGMVHKPFEVERLLETLCSVIGTGNDSETPGGVPAENGE